MARIRTIKPEFFDDPDLAAMSHAARLAFIGLWTQADRAGRLADDPTRLRARLFPYEPRVSMTRILDQLASKHFIHRYQVDGKGFIQIRTFPKHQHVNIKEPPSTIPAPDEHHAGTMPTPDQDHADTQGTGRELEGKGRSTKSPESRFDSGPVVLEFPVVGTDARVWHLTQSQVDGWVQDFPMLDITHEAKKAHAWVMADPRRRKTARGMRKFLVAWLNRATERPQSNGHAAPDGRYREADSPRLASNAWSKAACPHGGACDGPMECNTRILQERRRHA